MRHRSTLLQSMGIAAFAFLASPAKAEERLTPADFADVAGIHSWLIEIPRDLVDGEYLSTCWSFPSVGGKPSQRGETGLDFRDVPKGTTAELFIWFEPWLERKGEGMDGMKYCVRYRENGGATRKKYGVMKIPDGYTDLHAFATSGERADGAWIMMMTNPDNEPERSSVFLDFFYVVADTTGHAGHVAGNEVGGADQPTAAPESRAKGKDNAKPETAAGSRQNRGSQ